LLIEAYFQQLLETINLCLIVQASRVTYDKRGTYEGFINGEIFFVDDSILHMREFVDVGNDVNRLMYIYQYMSEAKTLIFRYDNTGHHRKLQLSTYPHHKHEGSEENVIPSSAPVLEEVLKEIEQVVITSR